MFELNDQELEQVAGGSKFHGSSYTSGSADGAAYEGTVYNNVASGTTTTKHYTTASSYATGIATGYGIGSEAGTYATSEGH